MLSNIKKQISNNESGFTLVELMTVVTIFAIISIITITTFPNFSSKVEFDNQVLDIAIDVRKAQVHGISAREIGVGTGVFGKGYGIHFDTLNLYSYILFIDENDNDKYDSITDTQLGSAIPIKNGFEIDDLCVVVSGFDVCTTAGLDVVFKRPNPDANITPTGTSAIVKIKDSLGNIRKVITTNTGQIYTD